MAHIDYEAESVKRGNWLDITGGSAKDSLTVLDYFAGKALGSLVASNTYVEDAEMFAVMAYRLAEAMLTERNKRYTPQNVVRGVTGKTYG